MLWPLTTVGYKISRGDASHSNYSPLLLKLTQARTFPENGENDLNSILFLNFSLGEIGILSCKIFDKETDSLCVWQRDKFPIRVPQLGKYEWQGNPENGDCSLRIVNADINYDDGKMEQITYFTVL